MNQIMVEHLQVVWNGVVTEVVDVHVVVLVDRNEVHLIFNKRLISKKIEVSYHSLDFDREYPYTKRIDRLKRNEELLPCITVSTSITRSV